MLELLVEGSGTSPFRILAHERDGPRLAILVAQREVLVLSRLDKDKEKEKQAASVEEEEPRAEEEGDVTSTQTQQPHDAPPPPLHEGERKEILETLASLRGAVRIVASVARAADYTYDAFSVAAALCMGSPLPAIMGR